MKISAATPKTETVAAPGGSQPDSVACSEWVCELEAACDQLEKLRTREGYKTNEEWHWLFDAKQRLLQVLHSVRSRSHTVVLRDGGHILIN